MGPTLTSTPSYLLSDRRKRKSGNCLVGVLWLLCANPLRRNPARRAFLSRGKGASNRAGRNMKHQYSRFNFNNKIGHNKVRNDSFNGEWHLVLKTALFLFL